jgi:hypothetical protein
MGTFHKRKVPLLKKLTSLFLTLVFVLALSVAPISAQSTLLGQLFGDGSTVTFTVPAAVPASNVLQVEVDGNSKPYIWASSTTVTLASAPASKAIINFKAVPSAVAAQKAFFSELEVGGYRAQGALVKAILTTTATVDFASAATLVDSADSSNITVTGAAVNDICVVGLPAAPTAGFDFKCFVSAADTVKIRAHNGTTGTVDPDSATYRVYVIKF